MNLIKMFRIDNTGSRIRFVSIVCIVAALLTLPVWGTQYAVMVVTLMGIYITLGHMWNLLAGYSGLVSLGLQMYIGVGAFALAVFSQHFKVPLILGLIIGGLVSMIIAIGLSYLLLRLRGMYFAIATWMFAQAMSLVIVIFPLFGKGQGLFITEARALTETQKYYFSIILMLVVTLVVVALLRSKVGLGLFAIRDNDTAAQTSGIALFKSRLIVMMVTGFVTGVCGGVYYIYAVWIQPTSAFGIGWTVAAVFIVVIGGIGTISGPIVGGIIYVFLYQLLSSPSMTLIGSWSMVILGVIAVAVILAAPKGIVGTLQMRFGFEVISARRWMRAYADRLPDPAR